MRTDLKSPYRGVRPYRRLQANIARDDFDYIFRLLLPHHGAKDAILGTLFHQFVERVRRDPAIKPYYDEENERRIIAHLKVR